ncbi:MAG: nicotianamine synthase family protein [Hyphomicrobiales bacterium]
MTRKSASLDEQIIEIANVIAFYAKRLTLMRGRDETKEALSRSYLSSGSAKAAYQTVSPWYQILEPIYTELEGLMQQADNADTARILVDTRVKPQLEYLHQIRAAYEFDKEIDAARSILDLNDPAQHLADIIDHQSYWILTEPVLEALKSAQNVAVIGSGPLPLTALAVAEQTDAAVTCFELDREAFDLGNQIIAHSPQKQAITCLNQLAEGGDVFEKFDAVISAVLLGVDLDSSNHIPKSETLNGFLTAVPSNAPVILRDPFRLGCLFYPAAETDLLSNVEVNRFDPSTAIGEPYRSSFLILRTSG